MNREIKFSYIWQHNETGRLVEHIWTLEQLEAGTLADQCNYEYRRKHTLVAKRQFTGLLDKHGNEIYDFDVLDEKYKCQVIWEGACWWVKSLVTDHKYPLARFLAMREMAGTPCEIIGNIYENEDLLNI